MGAPEIEAEFAAALAPIAARADEIAARVIATGDRDAIARCASRLEEFRAELGMVGDSLKRALPRLIGFGETAEVEGLGAVVVHSGTKRRGWRKPEMQARAIGMIADEPEHFTDMETGERRPPAETVRRVIDRFLDFFGLGTPKLGGWKAADIDPDDYAEVERGAATVQLPPRKGRTPGEIIGADDE